MNKFSWPLFNAMPIVAIGRNLEAEDLQAFLPGFLAAGLSTLEITLNSPNASALIEALSEEYQGQLNIGAGTVRNMDDLEIALKAGASFIVTPILDEAVIKECVRLQIPVFPGAFSPTEIYKAWDLGATMIKIFPASAVGPDYLKDILAPLNDLEILPTGGVNLGNIPAYFKAGARGFGIGSPLFDKKLIKEKDWEGLREHFAKFTQLIQELTEGKK